MGWLIEFPSVSLGHPIRVTDEEADSIELRPESVWTLEVSK